MPDAKEGGAAKAKEATAKKTGAEAMAISAC